MPIPSSGFSVSISLPSLHVPSLYLFFAISVCFSHHYLSLALCVSLFPLSPPSSSVSPPSLSLFLPKPVKNPQGLAPGKGLEGGRGVLGELLPGDPLAGKGPSSCGGRGGRGCPSNRICLLGALLPRLQEARALLRRRRPRGPGGRALLRRRPPQRAPAGQTRGKNIRPSSAGGQGVGSGPDKAVWFPRSSRRLAAPRCSSAHPPAPQDTDPLGTLASGRER